MKKISLPNQILIGFILGILLGLFFGERIAFVKIVGDAFIALLQMAVLPFVSFSLMSGLGQMSFKQAGLLAKKGALFMLILWGLSFILILLFPIAFPDWQAASYFDSSMLVQNRDFNFVELFIPKNPFSSYANNIVPAVVVFSVAIGIALMGVGNKEGLIKGLKVINEALLKITGFVVRLAPIGVCAITANAAGTLVIDEVNKIQVFLIIYIVFALIASFYFFPVLITLLTPIKYGDVLKKNKGLLITAFATGNLFIVLSLLITRCSELLATTDVPENKAKQDIGIIIPTAFNFPSAGKLFSLTFLLFAGWYSGLELSSSDMPKFIALGLFTFFGNTVAALEFLLDFFRIPIDSLQLFMLVDIVTSRFGTLLAAMYFITLSLISTYSIYKPLKIKVGKLIGYIVIGFTLVFGSIIGMQTLFDSVFEDNYQGQESLMHKDILSNRVSSKILTEASFIPDNPYYGSLEAIQRRGFLRVGFFKDALPYAFKNSNGQMVGFDIDLAHKLADDIGVRLEFLEITREDFEFVLDNNIVDLVMSGVMITTNENITYSEPYSKGTFGFLVEDHRREEFNSREALFMHDSIKLGIVDTDYYKAKVKKYLPKAKIEVMDSPKAFLTDSIDLDAFVMSAEAASAWTLLYPNYSVTFAYPDLLSAPISIAISKNNLSFVSYLNTWLELKRYDQTFDRLTDYWIYGKVEEKKGDRWNILDDVIRKED